MKLSSLCGFNIKVILMAMAIGSFLNLDIARADLLACDTSLSADQILSGTKEVVFEVYGDVLMHNAFQQTELTTSKHFQFRFKNMSDRFVQMTYEDHWGEAHVLVEKSGALKLEHSFIIEKWLRSSPQQPAVQFVTVKMEGNEIHITDYDSATPTSRGESSNTTRLVAPFKSCLLGSNRTAIRP